jgi:hypothetical protein
MMMMMMMFKTTTVFYHCQVYYCRSDSHLLQFCMTYSPPTPTFDNCCFDIWCVFYFNCACYCNNRIYCHANHICLCAFQIFSLRNVPLVDPKNRSNVQFQCIFGQMCLERIVSVHSRGIPNIHLQSF